MNSISHYVRTSTENSIGRIRFYHPASNSFPSEQLHKLTMAIEELSNNKNITTVILESEGTGAFCAGASFDELLSIQDLEEGKLFFSGFANVINAIRKSPQIYIGRIHGKAVGGGVGLAAACDYCFATENASIKLSELAIGIGPFVIEPAVSRKIGKTAFATLSLAAQDWKDASWAFQHGLYSKLVADIEALDIEINAFAHQFEKYNPEAISEIKKILWEGTDHWKTLLYERALTSGKLVLSDFTVDALKQFKAK